MKSIGLEEFIQKTLKINKSMNEIELRNDLLNAINLKKNNEKCTICGSPIWAIGTAISEWNGCFTCITGEANSSEDFEIDIVNY